MLFNAVVFCHFDKKVYFCTRIKNEDRFDCLQPLEKMLKCGQDAPLAQQPDCIEK